VKQEKSSRPKKPVLSIEILPPKRGQKISTLFRNVQELLKYNPKFINVTNHQSSYEFVKKNGITTKIPGNKRTGTIGVASAIFHKFDIVTVPHLICGGMDKFRLEELLIDLNYLEINNLFVVRGDPIQNEDNFRKSRNGFGYAHQMVKQISQMNSAKYLMPLKKPIPSNFCIGVAGYPEKHYEAQNLESDLIYLKQKVDMGASYIITQMFYSFQKFKIFTQKAREIGITVPIIPGIKPIIKKKLLDTLPKTFFFDAPVELVEVLQNTKSTKQELVAGTKFTTQLVEKLLDFGVPGIHIFTMGKGKGTKALLDNFEGIF